MKLRFDHSKDVVWEALGLSKEYYDDILGEAIVIARSHNTLSEIVERLTKVDGDVEEKILLAFFAGRELGRMEGIRAAIKASREKDDEGV
ncbi:MAG TPA: hypothetical protein ENF41_00660 [Candidatus Bathyarchaeota archaeon]|nr:hypothetical protein [Candidatus Bathyarchaeota archaeon]